MKLVGTPNLGDYIPQIASLDLHRVTKKMKAIAKAFDVFFEKIIDEHVRSTEENRSKYFVDVMLGFMGAEATEYRLERDTVKAILLTIFPPKNLVAAHPNSLSTSFLSNALVTPDATPKDVIVTTRQSQLHTNLPITTRQSQLHTNMPAIPFHISIPVSACSQVPTNVSTSNHPMTTRLKSGAIMHRAYSSVCKVVPNPDENVEPCTTTEALLRP
ncbi:hypothetical protein QYF36_018092 [Acer negundo]|nr:hypothetical protein QYF36_018092 [Acer negundo]